MKIHLKSYSMETIEMKTTPECRVFMIDLQWKYYCQKVDESKLKVATEQRVASAPSGDIL